MGKEEQIEEREVLDSIFPDEITGAYPTFFLQQSQNNHLIYRYLRVLLPHIDSIEFFTAR